MDKDNILFNINLSYSQILTIQLALTICVDYYKTSKSYYNSPVLLDMFSDIINDCNELHSLFDFCISDFDT